MSAWTSILLARSNYLRKFQSLPNRFPERFREPRAQTRRGRDVKRKSSLEDPTRSLLLAEIWRSRAAVRPKVVVSPRAERLFQKVSTSLEPVSGALSSATGANEGGPRRQTEDFTRGLHQIASPCRDLAIPRGRASESCSFASRGAVVPESFKVSRTGLRGAFVGFARERGEAATTDGRFH